MLSFILWASLLWQAPALPKQAPQAQRSATEVHLGEQVDAWLAAGEHQDIPWKIQIAKPVLTYQQRMVVKVIATIDAAVLQSQSVRRDLVFMIKVADENGQWFPGENFVPQRLDSSLGKQTNLEMESEVLLKPGKYKIATIVYDSVLDQHSVAFNPVEVGDIKHDPLPHLLDHADRVEFVRGGVPGADAFSPVRNDLTVTARKPIQLDLLVDLSSREQQPHFALLPDYFGRGRALPPPLRQKPVNEKTAIDRLMQSASMVSGFDLKNGCLRVSAFDAIKKRVELEPTGNDGLDWTALRNKVLGPDRDTISINALQTRRDTPKFVRDQFDKLVNHTACAAAKTEKLIHVIVVLSHGLEFPDGSQRVRLEDCGCTLIYLRQSDTRVSSDQLKGMLSPLSPKVLEFHDPLQFRQKLADLLNEIQRIAQ